MAERDASLVQLDFPQLTADIIAALRLTGTLGLFNMSDTVIPVISVGNVRPQTFTFEPTVFASAEILSGTEVNPVANTVVADTGALPAGIYDIWAHISVGALLSVGTAGPVTLQHRNAANNATLAELLHNNIGGTANRQFADLPVIGYTIGLNERFRFITPPGSLTGTVSASLGFTIRLTP